MATKITLRKDTTTNWEFYNPILDLAEQGFETNTGKKKIGDGVTAWNSLPYDESVTTDKFFTQKTVGTNSDVKRQVRFRTQSGDITTYSSKPELYFSEKDSLVSMKGTKAMDKYLDVKDFTATSMMVSVDVGRHSSNFTTGVGCKRCSWSYRNIDIATFDSGDWGDGVGVCPVCGATSLDEDGVVSCGMYFYDAVKALPHQFPLSVATSTAHCEYCGWEGELPLDGICPQCLKDGNTFTTWTFVSEGVYHCNWCDYEGARLPNGICTQCSYKASDSLWSIAYTWVTLQSECLYCNWVGEKPDNDVCPTCGKDGFTFKTWSDHCVTCSWSGELPASGLCPVCGAWGHPDIDYICNWCDWTGAMPVDGICPQCSHNSYDTLWQEDYDQKAIHGFYRYNQLIAEEPKQSNVWFPIIEFGGQPSKALVRYFTSYSDTKDYNLELTIARNGTFIKAICPQCAYVADDFNEIDNCPDCGISRAYFLIQE